MRVPHQHAAGLAVDQVHVEQRWWWHSRATGMQAGGAGECGQLEQRGSARRA
jgi:hypothetical protein